MARNLRIRVDHNTCVGNAMCETFPPNVFRLIGNRRPSIPQAIARRRSAKRQKIVP